MTGANDQRFLKNHVFEVDSLKFYVNYNALCVPSDSDPNFQKSYQNLITFWGEILPNSDSKF